MNSSNAPRLCCADRMQQRMEAIDLDSLIGDDHQARAIWTWVEALDLSALLDKRRARGSNPGRAAIDPRILLCLWLQATLDGVGSARMLDELCAMHHVYRWICGGVSVNYHTLADFRSTNGEFLDQLLTQSMAVLIQQNLVKMELVAQDGVRVRASAGRSSFRRDEALCDIETACKQQVEKLRQELKDQPDATTKRQRAARLRALREREERLAQAREALKRMRDSSEATRQEQGKQADPPDEPQGKGFKKKAKPPRASTTDPDARRMKMGNGGVDPAYNIQYITDSQTSLIVACEVLTKGNDQGAMMPLSEQILKRYGKRAEAIVADGGYQKLEDITAMEQAGTTVYVPLKKPPPVAPKRVRRKDTPETLEWRARMETEEAKDIYRKRGSLAEWVNAQARNHGLVLLAVRGVARVKAVALLHALAINLQTIFRLKFA